MTVQLDLSDSSAAARHHLELRTGVIVDRVLDVLDDALGRGIFHHDDVARQFPFLAEVTERLDDLASGHRRSRAANLRGRADDVASAATGSLPLDRLAQMIGSPESRLAADIVAATAMVERDVRLGAVVAFLQAPAVSRRPCLGLLALLLEREVGRVAAVVDRLAAAGVVLLEPSDDPLAEQTVRLPRGVLAAIEGAAPEGADHFAFAEAPTIEDLVLPADLTVRIARATDLLARGELDVLVIRGATGSGRRTVLRTAAGCLGRGLLVTSNATGADPSGARGAIALLSGSMLAWCADPGLGQLATLSGAVGVEPVGVICGFRGAVSVEGRDRVAVIDLPIPDPAARRRFWTIAGLSADVGVLDTVSDRYILSGGTIRRVATQANAIARLDGRPQAQADDVRQAAQDHGRQRLESLAALLPALTEGFQPVLSGATLDAYEALVLRSRYREVLGAAVGGAAGSHVTRGVRALLSGPSGTGKTLAARALGARLALDVYRANLAALVDKYIGETERRLDELFSRAEELDVVLLIDEGDALMTRRTDVRSSNDRYANLETDYLLQRLETYEGIVLITTNAPQLIDSAFHRRLDVRITFGPPDHDDRLRIWRQHLPDRHAVPDVTLDAIASACPLSGGQIRNASVHAALLALQAGRRVDDALLRTAVDREYTIGGKTSPLVLEAIVPSPFERAVASR